MKLMLNNLEQRLADGFAGISNVDLIEMLPNYSGSVSKSAIYTLGNRGYGLDNKFNPDATANLIMGFYTPGQYEAMEGI